MTFITSNRLTIEKRPLPKRKVSRSLAKVLYMETDLVIFRHQYAFLLLRIGSQLRKYHSQNALAVEFASTPSFEFWIVHSA